MTRDRVAAAALLLFGLAGAFEARRLVVGTASRPGPGLFPFWLAVALCVVAGALLLRRGHPVPARGAEVGLRRGKVVLTLSAGLAYAFAMEPLGFTVTTFLFLLVLLSAIGPQRRIASLTISALTSGASYLVFKVWLAVQLPAGPWGF